MSSLVTAQKSSIPTCSVHLALASPNTPQNYYSLLLIGQHLVARWKQLQFASCMSGATRHHTLEFFSLKAPQICVLSVCQLQENLAQAETNVCAYVSTRYTKQQSSALYLVTGRQTWLQHCRQVGAFSSATVIRTNMR